MLYMARGEQESAKKAVDFGLKCLQYHGIKGGYVLALLQGRLNSDFTAGEARQLYDKAEKLRQQGKFVEAGQLFAQVLAAYPKNPWGHASGFRIGQCYVGLGRPAQAADWWQKFIKQSPTGPWRGQAHVAMVDLVLETQLDLKKATEHALAATKGLSQFSRSENGTVPLAQTRAPSRPGKKRPTTSTSGRASFPWSMAASTPPRKASSRRSSISPLPPGEGQGVREPQARALPPDWTGSSSPPRTGSSFFLTN